MKYIFPLKIQKVIVSFFLITTLCSMPIQNAQELSPELTEFSPEALEEIRENIEEQITSVRSQTNQIGFAIQQLTQAIYANKVSLAQDQKEKTLKELIEIQDFIDLLLNKILIQTSSDIIPTGLLLNNILAKHLLYAVKTNLSHINYEKIQSDISNNLESNLESIDAKTLESLMIENQTTVTDLINATSFIGLTWYNKTSRFLKKNNAYEIARGTTVILASTIAAACIYKAYFNTNGNDSNGYFQGFLNKLGNPGQLKRIEVTDTNGNVHFTPEYDPVTGAQLKNPGTGIFKFCDMYNTAGRYGFVAATPLVTIPLKEMATSIYYQYWVSLKTKSLNRWNQFESFCLGSEKKQNLGDCEKVYFKDMTGAQDLEELAKRMANFLLHPERYERTQIEEHRGILLWGPPQTGKTLFVKALKTMIDEQQTIKFFDAKKFMDYYPDATIDEVFMIAKRLSPCILFIDEIDLIAGNREKNPIATRQLLTNMQGIDMASSKIFIIGATNKLEQLDKALLVDGRFGKLIHVPYPEYFQRKSYLEQQLAKRSIQLDPVFIDYVAQETEGSSYNKLKRIISESLILSTIALRPVTQNDFEKTLDVEIRKIAKSSIQVSAEEKRVIATYQAGKALIRELLKTKKEVVKITILPVSKTVVANEYGWAIKTDQGNSSSNEKLAEQTIEHKSKDGEVFTKTSTTNATLISDEESKKEILCLLAGSVAQNLLLKKTFSACNPHDRADAMKAIYAMISQGEPIDKAMRTKALEIKACYEKEIEKLLSAHQPRLEQIINMLVLQNNIDRYEWANINK